MTRSSAQIIGSDTLDPNTDYLFCPVCGNHVACQRVESGGWEVQCPGCVGECGLCKCYLQRFCFGSREQFPPFEAPNVALFGKKESSR